jgi:ferredoxin
LREVDCLTNQFSCIFGQFSLEILRKAKLTKVMAIKITDECINCGACEPECPNTAIYEGGREWNWAGGTKLETVELNGTVIDAKAMQKPVSDEFYYIVSGKCTECTGFHEEPQCAAVCPVDCCVPDPDHVESKEVLMARKIWLHQEGVVQN